MRSTATIAALVAVILVSALLAHRALFPPAPKRAGVVKPIEDGQIIARAGMEYLFRLRPEGRRPGVAPDVQGNADIGGRLSYYPGSLTMRFNKEGEPFTGHDTIVQLGAGFTMAVKAGAAE